MRDAAGPGPHWRSPDPEASVKDVRQNREPQDTNCLLTPVALGVPGLQTYVSPHLAPTYTIGIG